MVPLGISYALSRMPRIFEWWCEIESCCLSVSGSRAQLFRNEFDLSLVQIRGKFADVLSKGEHRLLSVAISLEDGWGGDVTIEVEDGGR